MMKPDSHTNTEAPDSETHDQNNKTRSNHQDSNILLETSPSTKPAIIKLFAIVGGTIALSMYLLEGTTVESESVVPIVVILGTLVAWRYVWVAFILRQTRYLVYNDKLVRQYTLLGKHDTRKIPLKQLRGTQLSRSRLEALLGVGTVQFLTGGMNQSLGFVKFEYIDDPGAIVETLEVLQQ